MLMWSPAYAPAGTTGYLPILVVIISGWAWAAGSIYSRYAPRPESALVNASMHMIVGGSALFVLGMLPEGSVTRRHVAPAPAGARGHLIVFGPGLALAAYVWLHPLAA